MLLTISKLVLHRLHTLTMETRKKSAYTNYYIHQRILGYNFIPYECNIIELKKKSNETKIIQTHILNIVSVCLLSIVYILDSKYHKLKGMNKTF